MEFATVADALALEPHRALSQALGGCGIRSREALAPAAYAASFATSIAHCIPSTATTDTAFFPMLSDIIPRESFDKDGPRFQELLSRAAHDDLPSVAAFQLAWNL